MNKILIVEDDNDLANLIKDYLSIDEIEGVIAENGIKALELIGSDEFSLVILDIMLPGLDGIAVCKKIRENSFVPIIMLSAKSGEMDKILLLGIGADDYMTKPFSPMELIARVKAHIRRGNSFISKPVEEDTRVYGDLKIYKNSYKVTLNEKEIIVTTREFQILDYLSANSGRVFSKEQLYESIWGNSEYMDENTIAVYIKRLRTKLGGVASKSIKTVWGIGYKWEYSDE